MSPEDMKVIATVSKLLGLDCQQLKPVLLLRQINVRGNVTEIPLRLQEVFFSFLLFHSFISVIHMVAVLQVSNTLFSTWSMILYVPLVINSLVV